MTDEEGVIKRLFENKNLHNDPPYFLISYIFIIVLLLLIMLGLFLLYINCIGLNVKLTLELPNLVNLNQIVQ